MNIFKTALSSVLTFSFVFGPATFASNATPAAADVQKAEAILSAVERVDHALEEDEKAGSEFYDQSGSRIASNSVLGLTDFYYVPSSRVVGSKLTFRIKSDSSDSNSSITVAVYDAPNGRRVNGLSRSVNLSSSKNATENRIIFDQTIRSLAAAIDASAKVSRLPNDGSRTPAFAGCMMGLVGAVFVVAAASVIVRKVATKFLPVQTEGTSRIAALKAKWSGMKLDSKILVGSGIVLASLGGLGLVLYAVAINFESLFNGREVPVAARVIGLPILLLVASCG